MVGTYPLPGQAVSGGIERVISTLLPPLARLVNLTLVVPGSSIEDKTTRQGVKVIYCKRSPGPGVLRYWSTDAQHVADVVAAERPDIVHVQGAAGAARLIAEPQLLTIHGIPHRNAAYSTSGRAWGPLAAFCAAYVVRIVELHARRAVPNIIQINPYVLEALPDIARHNLYSIPNPIDPAFCLPLTAASKTRAQRVLSIGRISPQKDTLRALSIVKRAMSHDPKLEFCLFGSPDSAEYLQRCQSYVHNAGLTGRIRFHSNVDTGHLIEALDGASILLLTSKQETAPVALAEAHARGVAVLAPREFGMKYMIAEGHNGIFLPSDGLDAQAESLRQALDHEWRRSEIAAHAVQHYNPETIARRTVGVYEEILASAVKPAAP